MEWRLTPKAATLAAAFQLDPEEVVRRVRDDAVREMEDPEKMLAHSLCLSGDDDDPDNDSWVICFPYDDPDEGRLFLIDECVMEEQKLDLPEDHPFFGKTVFLPRPATIREERRLDG